MRRATLERSRSGRSWRGIRVLSLMALAAVLPLEMAEAQTASTPTRGLGRQADSRPDSLAVTPVEVAPAVAAAAAANQNAESLARFDALLEDRLGAALAGTRKFTLVARSRLGTVLGEQAFAASGFVNPRDPAAAQAMKVAGVRWLAVPRIIDFEDIVRERRFEGIDRVVSRRTIRAAVTVEVLDSTTGVVGETATLTLESIDTADEDVRARPKGGDPTSGLIESLSSDFAAQLACRLLDVAYPATILSVNGDTVTINRGDGGCLEVGQQWIASQRGAALVDPDTGENLGYDERDSGAIEVTRIEPRLARGRIIAGSIGSGAVLRSVPKGWTPSGFRAPGGGSADVLVTPGSNDRPDGAGVLSSDPRSVLAGLGPVAVVAETAAGAVSPAMLAAIETEIGGAVAGTGVRVVNPSEVIAARSSGEGEPDDDASLVRLAEAVGADWLLVAGVASAGDDSADTVVSGRQFRRVSRSIRGSWRLVAATDAASIAGGPFDGVASLMQAAENDGVATSVSRDLDQQAATAVGSTIASALAADAPEIARRRGDAAAPAAVGYVRVEAVLDGLVVPEIVQDEQGRWVVGNTSLPVLAGGAEVALDGFVVGSTPSVIDARPGPHRLTLTRQGVQSWSRSIRVTGGKKDDPQVIRAGLQLDGKTRDQYLANAAAMEGLKQGAALTAAQVEAINGFATFLQQSGYRIDRRSDDSINIDSDQVPEVMQRNSFWSRW